MKKVTNCQFILSEESIGAAFKSSKDVLSPFFEIQEEKPNIVLIVVVG
jgi:hypothetical protein